MATRPSKVTWCHVLVFLCHSKKLKWLNVYISYLLFIEDKFLQSLKPHKTRECPVLQFAARLLLPASPAVKSAIIFNTVQSDSHTSVAHSNVYGTFNTVHGIMINNCLPARAEDTHRFFCKWQEKYLLPLSRALSFHLIPSAPSVSLTVFCTKTDFILSEAWTPVQTLINGSDTSLRERGRGCVMATGGVMS